MTKSTLTTKKPCKQHFPEFRQAVQKIAERICVAAAVRQPSMYELQLYAWCSKQHQLTLSERES